MIRSILKFVAIVLLLDGFVFLYIISEKVYTLVVIFVIVSVTWYYRSMIKKNYINILKETGILSELKLFNQTFYAKIKKDARQLAVKLGIL